MIGYVPQETYLHDASLRENIAFGVDKNLIDDIKVEKVSKLASLSDFVKTLDNGLKQRLEKMELNCLVGRNKEFQ